MYLFLLFTKCSVCTPPSLTYIFPYPQPLECHLGLCCTCKTACFTSWEKSILNLVGPSGSSPASISEILPQKWSGQYQRLLRSSKVWFHVIDFCTIPRAKGILMTCFSHLKNVFLCFCSCLIERGDSTSFVHPNCLELQKWWAVRTCFLKAFGPKSTWNSPLMGSSFRYPFRWSWIWQWGTWLILKEHKSKCPVFLPHNYAIQLPLMSP